jgi:hypothetical protein
VRDLLRDSNHVEFHEAILELLGAAGMSRGRVFRHLATLTGIFDAAATAIQTPFPFESDLSGIARPIVIDGSLELIGRGYHREAMFWIAVAHSRCQKLLSGDVRGASAEIHRQLSGPGGRPRHCFTCRHTAALC